MKKKNILMIGMPASGKSRSSACFYGSVLIFFRMCDLASREDRKLFNEIIAEEAMMALAAYEEQARIWI